MAVTPALAEAYFFFIIATITGRNIIAASMRSKSFDVRAPKYATTKNKKIIKKTVLKSQRTAFIFTQPFLLDHTM